MWPTCEWFRSQRITRRMSRRLSKDARLYKHYAFAGMIVLEWIYVRNFHCIIVFVCTRSHQNTLVCLVLYLSSAESNIKRFVWEIVLKWPSNNANCYSPWTQCPDKTNMLHSYLWLEIFVCFDTLQQLRLPADDSMRYLVIITCHNCKHSATYSFWLSLPKQNGITVVLQLRSCLCQLWYDNGFTWSWKMAEFSRE